MAERGWTAPTWPREYGGGGLSKDEAKVLREEMAKPRLRPPLVGFGLEMIGPLLLETGNEEQKREHIPRIVRGQIRWCQGYSEPGAGSDLAGLQTRAVRDGDDYILDGQKVWTSYADKADWMFLLVRTDTSVKHAGITFILMDMESPGVSVKAILLISGSSPFCETFIENVRVPVRNVVGQVNGGWAIAKMLLRFERNMIADVFKEREDRSRLIMMAQRYLAGENGHVADAVVRDRIAQSHDLGQGKVQMGPAMVLGFISKKWVGGIFPQHWWFVAGSRATPVTSQTDIQYFLARMLPGAWQLSLTPNILIDWRAEGRNRVTFPIGLGFGRTFRLGGCPASRWA